MYARAQGTLADGKNFDVIIREDKKEDDESVKPRRPAGTITTPEILKTR